MTGALQNPFVGMNGVLDYWHGRAWAPHPLLPQAQLLMEHQIRESTISSRAEIEGNP